MPHSSEVLPGIAKARQVLRAQDVMLVYLLIFFGWVSLWFRPTAATFNLFGLIVALWLILGGLLAGVLVPQAFKDAMLMWVAYMAIYLLVGAAIMTWRRRELGITERSELLPTIDADKVVRESWHLIALQHWPIWLIGAAVLMIAPLISGQGLIGVGWGLLIAVCIFATPFVPILLLWLILKIIALIRGPRSG